MGWSKKRVGKRGRVRYTAYYRDAKGEIQSAGTFAKEKDSERAWQDAEAGIRAGKRGDPRRGKQTFKNYVERTWLPNHQMELRTRQNYTRAIRKWIMPEFGGLKMDDIGSEQVRAWIAKLQRQGASAHTIQYCKGSVLNAIFTTALRDEVITSHPSRGLKTPPAPRKPKKIITAEQFDTVYQALPNASFRLLVETDIESGVRWGELTELRVKDIDLHTRILTVSRTVIELEPEFHPTGGQFLVKDYPKDRECREFKLSQQIVDKIAAHIAAENLRDDDLLFRYFPPAEPKAKITEIPDPDSLGLTEPNEKGRQYKHGTMSGYGAGKCRCEYCRASCAIYRAKRRAVGKDNPRKPRARTTDADGHISRDWFRRNIWQKAFKAADLGFKLRVHDLRHAHASWLLAGGADLQVVKERLGHSTIATTEKYLHALQSADETALDALDKIRSIPLTRDDAPTEANPNSTALKAAEEKIAQLQATLADLAVKLTQT